MTLNFRIAATALLLFVGATAHSVSQTVIDARTMFVPIQSEKLAPLSQLNGFVRPMMMVHTSAEALATATSGVRLENFPVAANRTAALVLERTRSVFDAKTEFYTHTKQGKVPMRVNPITSFRGTVDGDPSTMVTLHYSEGDLTGFIQFANGQRTMVGRDFDIPRSATATPHLIADEATMFNGDPLSKFICNADELPFDREAIIQKMHIPSSVKGAEQPQAEYLREFTLAIVLREDIDSVMKRRGQSDQEIVQYFLKIISAMSQAYEQELNAALYLGYFEKFTEDEPSGYYYDGRSPGELLNEFSMDWAARMNSVDRTVAHLYALIRPVGGSFVGGIAYLNQLCNKRHRGGYGVSTVYLNASEIPGNPTRSNAFVWDVFVAAHEMGHNVGANHTHNCVWSPPVDTCQLQSDNTDACFNTPSMRRVIDGTIMSYCHLVNGSRTPLTFGPRVAERMRTWIATSSCAPLITSPKVTLTEPRGSTTFNLNETMVIRWSSARVDRVSLFWGASVGGPWTPIVRDLNATDQLYRWNVPALPSAQFWVRIEDASNPAVNDTSLASYRVAIPVVLDVPKGGERLGQGATFTVRWTKSSGVGNVKLEFAPDGVTWQTVEASSSANSINWTVPSIVTDKARMRVSALSAPEAPSTSGEFAIGVARFALEIPEENGILCKNFPNQYRWSADFIPSIRIQYSTDNGGAWRTATSQSTIDPSVWQVFSRNPNMNSIPSGTPCILRVVDAQTEEVLDTRQVLTINECDAALSVQDQGAMPSFSLVRVSPNPASSNVGLEITGSTPATVQVLLVTADGREVMLRNDVQITPGSTTVHVPLGVAAGQYTIVVREGNMQTALPLLIIR